MAVSPPAMLQRKLLKLMTTNQLFQLAVFLFNRLAQVFYQSMLCAIFAGWRIQLFVTKVEFLF
ncbi:hypothetical protein, partial [Escherichia coli]|uniref:hypothetical protein n=1 Tax=Escherichia coli TaxID=562 RepID=UPI000A5EA369